MCNEQTADSRPPNLIGCEGDLARKNEAPTIPQDGVGSVYVVDACPTVEVCRVRPDRVLKLAAGSNTQTVLPFTDLDGPQSVAVDTVGNVYLADRGPRPGAEAAA